MFVVKIDAFEEKDNNTINDEIRSAFQETGIGFQTYWLWDEDYNKILDGETRTRLYTQEKLNYSLLVEYLQMHSSLCAVTMIIPDNLHLLFQLRVQKKYLKN